MARERTVGGRPARSVIALVMVGLLATLSGLLAATPAGAVTAHSGANLSSYWSLPGTAVKNVDQHLWVGRKAPTSSWVQNWTWSNATFGGVLGFQTNATRFDRTTGDTAIFTLQNATAARGPACGKVTGDAPGYSCRRALTLQTDRYYRLRLSRQGKDGNDGWWSAWVKDERTGTDYLIGTIQVAAKYDRLGAPRNLSDYLGPAVSCRSVPESIAYWTHPDTDRYAGTYSGYTRGSCTDGTVTAYDFGWSKGVKTTLGGLG
jgi:hypothetical protein